MYLNGSQDTRPLEELNVHFVSFYLKSCKANYREPSEYWNVANCRCSFCCDFADNVGQGISSICRTKHKPAWLH